MDSDEAKVIQQANLRPPDQQCHGAVLHWLVLAGVIDIKKKEDLTKQTNISGWGKVLVSPKDPVCLRGELETASGCRIVGFYTEDLLQHSMVSIGKGLLAGVRNGNVLTVDANKKVGPAAYAIVSSSQLAWEGESKVRGQDVRWATLGTVKTRIG